MRARSNTHQAPYGVLATAVCCLAICATVAAGASCNCNNGNVDIYTPQCVCSCYSGYLLPRCLYGPDDIVSAEIWMSIPPTAFDSTQLLQTLMWALPIVEATEITFLYAHPHADVNKTAAYVSMKGDRLQQLVWDFTSMNGWLDDANIESVWERIPSLPESTTYGTTLSVYRSTDGKILITLENIMWLISALVVVTALSVLETCWLSNNEEEVFEYMIEHHPALTNLVDGTLVPAPLDEEAADTGPASHHKGDTSKKSANPLSSRPSTQSTAAGQPRANGAATYGENPRAIFTERSRR